MKTPQPQPRSIDPEDISAHIAKGHQELVEKVEVIAASVDAEFAFQALVTSLIGQLTKDYREAQSGTIPVLVELAAFHLYPRFGQGGTREPGHIQAIIDALGELNQSRGLQTAFSVDGTDRELASLQVRLRLHAESVRGSSYPHQTRRRIEEIQVPFERWFHAKAGIGPGRALKILDAAEEAVNDNFQIHKEKLQVIQTRMKTLARQRGKKSPDAATTEGIERERNALDEEFAQFVNQMPLVYPPSFTQVAGIVSGLTREEWDALRELIGLTPDSRRAIQQPRELKDRCVYYLSGDRFIFIDISSVYDALFEAFDRLTRTDLPFRDKYYISNLKLLMETEVCDFLRRLFPPSAVYQELTYPDPDHPGGETELDAAVVWGPFLILCEVKGKQFRPRSRVGDPSRLRDDLKDNIEEAFEQANRATRFIEATPKVVFVEKRTGRKLEIQMAFVRRIFPVSVTLHHFGGLATQLALLKRIGLFKDSAYPWSVSLADLEVITLFAGSPDVFLHYVQRRLDLQRSEKNIMGDELDIFGLYLDTRLHPSQFWEREDNDGRELTLLCLSGGSVRFDEWFQAEQGLREEKPDIRLKLPVKFSAVIDELRRRDDDGARWIAFALLGLSQVAVSSIEDALESLGKQAKADGRLLRTTIHDGELVVSVLAASGWPADELRRHSAFRATVEKYRLKAKASVSLGIDIADPTKPFDYAFWVEGPWVANSALDEALKEERPKAIPGQKLPRRNQTCFCGSGRKFKKCCLGKITVLPS